MKLWRHFTLAHRRGLLAFVLATLGMQALVPAGLMVAPSPHHFAQIILCPQTHPLARAVGVQTSPDGAALHAALGHAPGPDEEPAPAAAAASGAQSCAYSGLALAGLLPDRAETVAPPPRENAAAPLPLRRLHLAVSAYLRPPLRAPPAVI